MKVPNYSRGEGKKRLVEKRVLVATLPDQKETHRIKKPDGTYASLFLGKKEWTLDGWEGQPTIGRALTECDEIKVGDYVLTDHNAFQNVGRRVYSPESYMPCTLDCELDPEEEVFSIPKSFCWVGLRPSGEMFCIGASMICRRVYEPSVFSEEDKALMDSFAGGAVSKDEFANVRLAMETRKKLPNFVYVDKMPEDPSLYFTGEKDDEAPIPMTSIFPGDVIAVYKNSDVEHKYVWENERKSLIRVNFNRDFLGVITEGLKYEL